MSNKSENAAKNPSEQSVVHTPEPWEVQGPSQDGHCLRIFAGGEYLATVGGSDQSMETIQSNANLFAAAPGLLQELEQMIRGAEYMGWPASELADAKKAVAKAKGL